MGIPNPSHKTLIEKFFLLLVLVSAVSSCKEDETNKTTGTLIVTFDTSGYSLATLGDCLTAGNDSSDCESYYGPFGKIHVEIWNLPTSGVPLFEGSFDPNKPVNLGEFNAGNYELDASFSVLQSGNMDNHFNKDNVIIQIIAGEDKNITINNWD